MGIAHASQTALIVCVICSGMFFGITNTLMTQVVMESAPVARPIASSAYSFVRFCGGAIAPFIAGKLGEHVSTQAPFYLGAGMTAIAVGMLIFYRKSLVPIEEADAPGPQAAPPSPAAFAPAAPQRRIVIAIGGGDGATLAGMSVPLARAQQAEVHVLNVVEREIVAGEDAIDLESDTTAKAQLDDAVSELSAAGIDATGELLHATGSHADVAGRILSRTAELGAATIVVGPEVDPGRSNNQVVGEVAARATGHVVVLHPEAGPLGRAPAASELNGSPAV
jgi:hypothetical protein